MFYSLEYYMYVVVQVIIEILIVCDVVDYIFYNVYILLDKCVKILELLKVIVKLEMSNLMLFKYKILI